jgi:hypothetical protein
MKGVESIQNTLVYIGIQYKVSQVRNSQVGKNTIPRMQVNICRLFVLAFSKLGTTFSYNVRGSTFARSLDTISRRTQVREQWIRCVWFIVLLTCCMRLDVLGFVVLRQPDQ